MSAFETPVASTSGISRRNILSALTGSNSEVVDPVPTVAQQKAAQQDRENQRKMEQNLELLCDRRDLLTEKLLRMNESLQAQDISIHLVKLHLETLRRCADDYERLHHEITARLSKKERIEERKSYETFEGLHNDIYVKLQAHIAQSELTSKLVELQNPPPVAPARPVYVQHTPHLQAPFPTFNGDPENWYSFKNMFQSVMARYVNESPAMKILQLRNALTGEAKDKIDQDVVNNNDYEGAWKILEAAYEDKRLILDTHIDAILDCPKSSKENRGKSLSKIVDTCTKHVDALTLQGFPPEGLAELMLVNVIYKKLDKETQEQWELKLGHEEMPVYDEFIEFLRERARVLQRTNRSQQPATQQSTTAPAKQRAAAKPAAAKSFVTTAKEVCPSCKGEHSIYRCSQFQSLSVQDRKALVVKERLCFNCLKKHRVADCPSEHGCKVQGCNRKHHSLLHPSEAASSSSTESSKSEETKAKTDETKPPEAEKSSAVSLCAHVSRSKRQVILSTAQVLMVGANGSTVKCRALLDSGSDSNIISEELARRLKLRMDHVDLPISGLNDIQTRVKYLLSTKIKSCVNSFATSILDFLVVPRVTSNLPVLEIDARSWPLPDGLALADPKFHTPGEIDLLIGNEIFFDLIKKGRHKVGNNALTLAETELGWVVGGSVPTRKAKPCPRVCQLNRFEEELNRTMSRFWEIENVQSERSVTAAEADVEQHFESTHTRDEDGRYIVRLPFNNLQSQLGDSYKQALKQLDRLVLSLARTPDKRIQYAEFLTEYLELGHMKEVTHVDDGGYYIPHHAVYKESSSTTKIRVVFNGSARTTSGISLNDTLQVGPTVQRDLLSIILKFCTHKVVLTADIPKMYRQVKLHKDDCKYQRILWRDTKGNLREFELQTVTYGVASSPHHATRALVQLAKDDGKEFPVAAQVVQRDSYIDDFLTGGSSVDEVIQIYKELSELLRRGGFGVHKFCSNSTEVLQAIPAELHEKQVSFEECEINNAIKTLGLIWNPQKDYFVFRVPKPAEGDNWTKRSVLSAISSLFDPAGFLGPINTTAKLVMQDIWRLGLDWDERLPEELLQRWMLFRHQLPAVHQMRKRRCVIPDDAGMVELHGFSDASMRAYGAVVYTRSVAMDGTISVNLVASKSRVAPLKTMTIPRLELCGAKLLAELIEKVTAALERNFDKVVLHCDSQIVLCWLKKPPSALNQFVSNRVAATLKLTPGYQWRYVRSEDNPADMISRGSMPEELLQNELWWKGSPQLQNPEPSADEPELLKDEMLPELKTATVLAVVVPGTPIALNRMSNFRKLQRAWVYVRRFIDYKIHKKRNFEEIGTDEIAKSERTLFLVLQQQTFGDLIKALKTSSSKHRMANLAPFIGDDGLVRVGGRLKHSAIPYDGKHQVLLPEHHVTEILVRKLHEENQHVGHSGLLAIVRERFWPIRVKQLIKKVISKCQTCARQKPILGNQFMGDLPSYRVTPSPAFSKVGIDYAGPFMLKLGGRGRSHYKAYVAVFICVATKAIHFELVSDLTTDTFIAALQRFAGRRGIPSDIYSDNATCFVGADHELAALRDLFNTQLHQRKLNEYTSVKGIRWHFIPPRSPHFGGLWEAGVKAMKHHMKRVVGETRLTYEEMCTFLAQTEAILNSRPLCPVSDDPNDLEVLTPSHFLIFRSAVAIPEPSYEDQKVGRLSRWQHIQFMQQHFWRRWSREYLHHLQGRQKWNTGVKEYKVGALVVLVEENLPPQQWRRGRIVATHPGDDGAVRVVTVKTSSSEFKRAVTKIAMLPTVELADSTGGE